MSAEKIYLATFADNEGAYLGVVRERDTGELEIYVISHRYFAYPHLEQLRSSIRERLTARFGGEALNSQ